MKKYPFKFLDAYNEQDTEIFFGRDEEIDALYKMAFQGDMLLVYGGSGTGKTSLINCGLAGKFNSYDWLAINVRRGTDINLSLQEKLKQAAGDSDSANLDLSWLDEDEEAEEIQTTAPASELTQQFKALYLKYFRPIYLIFDQFEELYVLGNQEEQARFIETVREILEVEQPVKMIFIIREEYLGHLFEFEKAVPQLLRKKLRIEPMNLGKVREVILGATNFADTNIHLEAGAEDQIVEEIFTKIKGKEKTLSIQLPYLQVFLDKLYLEITGDQQRQAEATFTRKALTRMGDIGDVLRDFLEEQARIIQNQLSKTYKNIPENAIWKILSPFATLEGTKEPLSVAALIERLPALSDSLIKETLQALEKSRILRYEENHELYEIAHDSLAARIAERRSDEEIALLEIRRLIKSQTALKEDAREFFSEKQLSFIDPFLDQIDLNEEEITLIEASRQAVAEQKAEAQRQAEAEKQRLIERQKLLEKNQKVQRRFLAGMGVLLAVMIVLAFWAIGKQREATKALDNNTRNQALAKAREYMSYGDSYAQLDNVEYACDSYNSALEALKEYPEEELYQQLEDKQTKTCDGEK